jgi:hypothetical protein
MHQDLSSAARAKGLEKPLDGQANPGYAFVVTHHLNLRLLLGALLLGGAAVEV